MRLAACEDMNLIIGPEIPKAIRLDRHLRLESQPS